MDALDELFTRYPILGSRKLKPVLKDLYDIDAGRERIRRLKQLMGLHTIYPKPNLSKPSASYKYPYLLKNFMIIRPNQVWATDITYIKLTHGWAYLIAILDWFSRYVLSWRLSNNLELPFCLEALDEALTHHDAPEIFNTDQGSHFTAEAWISRLKSKKIRISMDGKGRCWDNIFTERLWRTVKCENVYIKGYASYDEAHAGLAEYFTFYNTIRPHQSFGQKTPCEIHFSLPSPEKRRSTIVQEERNTFETTYESYNAATKNSSRCSSGSAQLLATIPPRS